MAALRDIARDFAAEIRDGIGWTIVYRTGRSWNALTIWSDIWNGGWETDDLNDAIGILKADPDAVIVNGYYCGHFGKDMTIDEIAAGIRWHYEGGRNRLADYCEVTQGRDTLEEGRKAAEAAGLPFCERLVDGGDDELSPYVYDGSMTLADREKMQQDREAFEKLADALREIAAKLAEALKPVINAVLSALKKLWKVSAKAIGVPPKWLHLAAHAKKARTRKKYRNRIRRYVFEALAAGSTGTSASTRRSPAPATSARTVRAGSAPARPCQTFRPARRLGRRERKEQPHEKDRTQERRPRHGLRPCRTELDPAGKRRRPRPLPEQGHHRDPSL